MLSRSASYAIRALSYMAANRPDDWSLNREIAHELELPPQFLTKILRALANEGLLVSQRGKAGGFRLSRSPQSITLLEIADPFDRLLDRRRCLLGHAVCNDDSPCLLHSEWRAAFDSMIVVLRQRTLADVAAEAAALAPPSTNGGAGVERKD